MKFPKTIYVNQVGEEDENLNAWREEINAVDDDLDITEVAEYQLVQIRKRTKIIVDA